MQTTFIKTKGTPIAALKEQAANYIELTTFEDLKFTAECQLIDIVFFDDQKYYFYNKQKQLYYWFMPKEALT